MTLAMSITTVIGLSLAGVSLALSNSYGHSQDYYSTMQSGRTTMHRMQDALRCAKLITGATDTSMIFWAQDDQDANAGTINKSEIVMWYFDRSSSMIKQCKIVYPDSLKASLNSNLTLSQVTITPSLNCIVTSDTYSKWTILATDVSDFHLVPDKAAPYTTYVKIDMTIRGADNTQPGTRILSAAQLRADSTGKVSLQNGTYVLDTTR